MSTPDPQPPPRAIEWTSAGAIIIDTTKLLPEMAARLADAFFGPVDPRSAEEIRDAAAYRRGMLRGAEVLDEYAEAIDGLPRDSQVVRECAEMLRTEADTPGRV